MQVAEPYFNQSEPLVDPPLQINEGSTPSTSTQQAGDSDGPCIDADRPELQRERQAPSREAGDQLINTVEVVKKDGLYHVVLDGVVQRPIRPLPSGSASGRSYARLSAASTPYRLGTACLSLGLWVGYRA